MISLEQFGNPPGNLVNNAFYTMGIVDEIFNAAPGQFKFNSGYRSPSRNASAGGSSTSYHLKALAADIGAVNGNYAQLKPLVISILDKYGYELIDESTSKNHFHIEPSPTWGGIYQLPFNSDNSGLIALGVLGFAWLIFG